MRTLCEDLRTNLAVVLASWESLVRAQPWYSLPAEHRLHALDEVVMGIVEAALCEPAEESSHRRNVEAAARHGARRREQGIPETMLATEFHLIRQAVWRYLRERFPDEHREITDAILRIDAVILPATNACMWGYYRTEVEALGKWEVAMERLVADAPRRRDEP